MSGRRQNTHASITHPLTGELEHKENVLASLFCFLAGTGYTAFSSRARPTLLLCDPRQSPPWTEKAICENEKNGAASGDRTHDLSLTNKPDYF
jgi:hypothetical protein